MTYFILTKNKTISSKNLTKVKINTVALYTPPGTNESGN